MGIDLEGNTMTPTGTPMEGDMVTSPPKSLHSQGREGTNLKEWLASINLEQYGGVFAENGFEDHMDGLTELTDHNLKELGINIMGHRLAIIKSIKQMNSSQ